VLAATILGSSMAFIDSTVVNVALPALQSTLRATITDVQWVVESYGLLLSALILVGGALGDSLGRRKMFLLGVIVFGAASAGCGLSATVRTLVIWRAVQGLSAAFLVPGSLAIISASFDEKSRGRAIGTWSGFTAMTMALGPVLGGWLVEHASWHWIFFINLPLAVLVVLITLWRVPDSRSPNALRVDWRGAAAATFGLAALVYGFLEAAVAGWTPHVLGTLISGVLSMGLFVLIEKRVSAPMVPLDLFRWSSFRGANLLTLFLYAALGAFFFLFPMNLIQIQKYPTTETGAASLPMIFLVFFLSRWSGGLVPRYGPKTPLVVGPLIMAAGFALFAIRSVSASYWTGPFPGFLVLGFGLAITVAPLTTVVMSSVEQDRAGVASGINNAVARVAGVLAIAVVGIVMVAAFASSLQTSITSLHLDASVVQHLQSNVARLGALDLPDQLDPQLAGKVRDAIIHAFLFGFRIVMSICAGLAVASSAVAWRLIRPAGAKANYE
jgi:EmrB/QacA subfamily drug resistance transporter